MTRRPGQGEAWAAWGLWGLTVGVVFATYARLEPAELYHVSREGLAGGLSRGLVLLNFPVALVSIALVLVAVAALPRRAWWVAGSAIALSSAVAWPGVVDQDDVDARWINAIPALGVLLGLVLTAWAAQRAGSSFAPWGSGDRTRLVVAVLVIALSLPWVAAELGFHLPGDLFLGEEPYREEDGTVLAAVHLGHHHGTDGALLLPGDPLGVVARTACSPVRHGTRAVPDERAPVPLRQPDLG